MQSHHHRPRRARLGQGAHGTGETPAGKAEPASAGAVLRRPQPRLGRLPLRSRSRIAQPRRSPDQQRWHRTPQSYRRRLALPHLDGSDRHQPQRPVPGNAGGASRHEARKHDREQSLDRRRTRLRGVGSLQCVEAWRPKGIRVIALMPGATDNAIWDTLWPKAPRRKMMSAETVARTVVDALRLPENTTVEKIVVMPSIGTL